MANPTPATRQTPSGRPLKDGYQSLITFAADPDMALWEKRVKPPGIDGGDKIEQTTMHNTAWRTFAARSLKTLTDGSFKFAYTPRSLDGVEDAINREDSITYEFASGGSVIFFGYLQKIELDEMEEGKQPEGTATIVATNWDPVNDVEAGPIFIGPTGTGTGTI